MELYNSLIHDIRALLPEPSAEWSFSAADCWKDHGTSELVMQKEAAFELGAAERKSANLVLFTSSAAEVPEDRIVLFGKDLPAISSDCDFARIAILRIGALDVEDEVMYRTLKDIEFSKYHVHPEGYMVRISPESYREQVRVSRKAVKSGISFRNIGCNYIAEYKKNFNVLSAELLFITDPRTDYEAFRAWANINNIGVSNDSKKRN